MESTFILVTTTNAKLFVRKWESDEPARAVVLLQHGMAEHSGRYRHFAEYLTNRGFIVYGADIRGHGKTTGSSDKLGFYDEHKGWYKVLEDLNCLHHKAIKENPHLPMFILGHSMGSFIVRHYAQQYRDMPMAGAVIVATGIDPGLLRVCGVGLSTGLSWIWGKTSPSKFMTFMSFSNFNNEFKPVRTFFDWLSRDVKQVDAYIADPLCGNIHTLGYWMDFLTGIGALSKPTAIRNTPKDLPLYFLTGSMDPVGNFGRAVPKLVQQYHDAGVLHINHELYIGARHELLNEVNRTEIYEDIANWLEKYI